MKCSLGISDFLEELSSLSHSIVFLYFFALITEEGFLICLCYSLELCIQMGLSFLFSFAFHFSSFLSYLKGLRQPDFKIYCKASIIKRVWYLHKNWGLTWWLSGNLPTDAGDASSVSGLGRSPGEGNGNLFQYACLGNSMDRGAWWAAVYRVTKELDTTNRMNNNNSMSWASILLGTELCIPYYTPCLLPSAILKEALIPASPINLIICIQLSSI